MRILTAASLVVFAGSGWSADSSAIGGPVSGFVIDSRIHSLRPINGIPGGAQLGDPVQLPFAVGVAAVSATQDYALATGFRKNGPPVLARGLRSGAPQTAAIDGAIAASGIAIADSGAVAVLYSNSDLKLQFVTGLPEAPQALDPVDLSALNGGVAALALDSAGTNALLVSGDGNLYWVAARGSRGVNWLLRAPGASSASLLPNGDDAVVGSSDTGEILLLHGISGSLSVRTIGGASNGITSARAVRAISDQEVAVVDGTGRLATITIDSGSTDWIALAGAAEGFESLGNNLMLLNHAGPNPLLLFDTAQGHATYFVPPGRNIGPALHRK